MSLTLAAFADRQWYDIISENEEEQRARSVRMTPTEWTNEVNRMLRMAPRGQIINVLAAVMSMDLARAAKVVEEMVSVPRSQAEVDWALWQDMVNEPEKYGDDIVEWLALDEQLRAGPKRWRVAAFWLQKEEEKLQAEKAAQAPWRALYSVAAKQAALAGERAWVSRDIKRHVARFRAETLARETLRNDAATVIAAAVRGHQIRSNSPFLNCCMCLAHRICPLQTDVGMMCRGCAEQGPYDEETGPIADPWSEFRADYVDLAAEPTDYGSDYNSEPDVDPNYIPEPRGERNRLHEFGVNRLFKCDWEQGNTGTCLWCGATFKRPYSGMFEGPNEFGYCSDECDRNRCCWLRMKWAGKKGPLDHEWLAGLKECVIREKEVIYEECRHCRCPLDEGQMIFCDRDCEYSYMREEWRDTRF
jgi:hypothetical protein